MIPIAKRVSNQKIIVIVHINDTKNKFYSVYMILYSVKYTYVISWIRA